MLSTAPLPLSQGPCLQKHSNLNRCRSYRSNRMMRAAAKRARNVSIAIAPPILQHGRGAMVRMASEVGTEDGKATSTSQSASHIQMHFPPLVCNREYIDERPLTLNIGGCLRQIRTSTLSRLPETRLGRIAVAMTGDSVELIQAECDYFDESTSQPYFERSPEMTDIILDYYRKNHLHYADIHCAQEIAEELHYWDIDFKDLPRCCLRRLQGRMPDIIRNYRTPIMNNHIELVKATNNFVLCPFEAEYDPYRRVYFGRQRKMLGRILDEPSSSIWALLFTAVSLGFIAVAVAALVIGSSPSFQYFNNQTNQTNVVPSLDLTDKVCLVWFTLEYFARLLVTPERCAFIRDPMSLIDAAAIFPSYVEIIMTAVGVTKAIEVVRLLRIMRVLRVLRILKMARYSKDMQTMGKTLQRSWRELSMMAFILLTCNLLFSTTVYFIESDEPESKFTSIPAASWWCIMTMTTVGYGDIIPKTVVGKMIGSLATIVGIMIVASPLSSVVQNFDDTVNDRPTQSEINTTYSELLTGCPAESPVKQKQAPSNAPNLMWGGRRKNRPKWYDIFSSW